MLVRFHYFTKPLRISSEVVLVDVVVVVVEEVVVEEVVVDVVDVVEVCISSSPERQVVTISSSLTRPPLALTSQPLQPDRGHCTYLSCSFTRRPL